MEIEAMTQHWLEYRIERVKYDKLVPRDLDLPNDGSRDSDQLQRCRSGIDADIDMDILKVS